MTSSLPSLLSSYTDCNPGLRNKHHLILDLDETLICALPEPTSMPKTPVHVLFRGKIVSYDNLVVRPGLLSFLETMDKYYNLHIFTCSHKDYAESVLQTIGAMKYMKSFNHRGQCQKESNGWIKDINSLPYLPNTMVLIDDSPNQIARQPDQSLQIKPFKGDGKDRELTKLIPFLIELSKCKDTRSVQSKFKVFKNTQSYSSLGLTKESSSESLALRTYSSSPMPAITSLPDCVPFQTTPSNNILDGSILQLSRTDDDFLLKSLTKVPSIERSEQIGGSCSSSEVEPQSLVIDTAKSQSLYERRHKKGSLSVNIGSIKLETKPKSHFSCMKYQTDEYDVIADEGNNSEGVAVLTPNLNVHSQRSVFLLKYGTRR